ncbi:MAG TPA: hypothetical protein VM686_42875 [Polyangiaceae bacterium]|nr:hypothetical protein [Polyangiaceae bacterium]
MPRLFEVPVLAALFLLAAPIGCGAQEVGEECEDVGDDDECEDGAICTNDGASPAAYCAWLCENDDHCPPDFECNGISGTSAKSCQPKK